MESNLRDQFPLSPRKFVKKLIEKFFLFILLGFFCAVAVVALYAGMNETASALAYFTVGVVTCVVVSLICTALYSIYVKYYIKHYYYSDDNDFITIKKGVFAPTEIHVQYLKIQDVYVDQDILDRILGIYDVHISSATATSGMEAHIDGVDKTAANGLKEILLGKIKRSTSGTRPENMGGSQSSSASESANTSKPEAHNVHFSSPINSDIYGLSENWWWCEVIKRFASLIYTPVIITFFISLKFEEFDFSTDLKIWLGIVVLTFIYQIATLLLWKAHYKYDFGQEYIYMKTGILSVSEKNMAYSTVQDVRVEQTLFDRLFGVADLVIENAAQTVVLQGKYNQVAQQNGVTVEGLSLEDARKIADELKKVVLGKTNAKNGL